MPDLQCVRGAGRQSAGRLPGSSHRAKRWTSPRQTFTTLCSLSLSRSLPQPFSYTSYTLSVWQQIHCSAGWKELRTVDVCAGLSYILMDCPSIDPVSLARILCFRPIPGTAGVGRVC